MARLDGTMQTPVGEFDWCAHPTDIDRDGCDGLYIRAVRPMPVRKWPLRHQLSLVWACTLAILGAVWVCTTSKLRRWRG